MNVKDKRSSLFWINKYGDTVMEHYENESDRAAGILAAEFLNHFLAEQLTLFFVDDESIPELFKGYNPLSSFSSRIDIAFALGLLSKEMKRDLTFIRKIRNHFAHHPDVVSFDTSPIKDWCGEFSNLFGEVSFESLKDQYLYMITIMMLSIGGNVSSQSRRVLPDMSDWV